MVLRDYLARCNSPHVKYKTTLNNNNKKKQKNNIDGKGSDRQHLFFPIRFCPQKLAEVVAVIMHGLLVPFFWPCSPALFSPKDDPFLCFVKLFLVLSVRLACGEAVVYLLNSLPSRKNGQRAQPALEVTSRYAGAPRMLLLPMWNYRTC